MNSRVLFVMALAVIASGCASSGPSNPSDDTSGPADNPVNTTTVTYTGSGFQPSTVTIQQGGTVTWVSELGSFWIASDQHPTHREYSGTSRSQHCSNGDQASAAFDQCSSGTQFSFTFEKTGTWTYHNHLNPAQGGTVVVE